MAYDGIVTCSVVKELKEKILFGKIEKVYQPQNDVLVFHIHAKTGKFKLLASVAPDHCRLHLIEGSPVNPPAPLAFCMLMRKHAQGGRITSVEQVGSERIVEIGFETINELGFAAGKKLIFEIMGKHSNIVLTDSSTCKIIDSVKRVSFDVNRVRQTLPGLIYQYPPAQDKRPFKDVTEGYMDEILALSSSEGDERLLAKRFLSGIGGISPAFATQLASARRPYDLLRGVVSTVGDETDLSSCCAADNAASAETASPVHSGKLSPRVYLDEAGDPKEFYVVPLSEYEASCQVSEFPTVSGALEFYFDKKSSSNQGRQKSTELAKTVTTHLNKLLLKKKRLSEDLLKAESCDELRLFGELLTANIHRVKPGAKSVQVTNYYDGTPVEIPLDEKLSASKNAQQYYKRFGKAKTAIKEKQFQLEENQKEIDYLESVLTFLDGCDDVAGTEAIREELTASGYLRLRRQRGGFKKKPSKPQPMTYTLSNGMKLMVGRNNAENDYLTFKLAGKKDLWFHTKDIHGSHAVLFMSDSADIGGENAAADDADGESRSLQGIEPAIIYEAAAIAAYHSQAKDSENVPVDYVPVRYVKKPGGAKPGMVIFTNNRTVWVNPALPPTQTESV